MQLSRRRTRRLSYTAAGALALAAVVVPASAHAATPTHSIAEVQGTGTETAVAGTTVTVHGVVTADHRGADAYRGIYVQTAGSGGATDATPGASDGIFVFLNARTTAAAIGDLVEVTGVAGEFNGLTQVNAGAADDLVTVLTPAAELDPALVPQPVALTDDVVGDAREQYEGMLVAPQGDYVVSSMHEADRFGSVWLAAGAVPVKSTELARPGPDADGIAAANAAATIILDDGRNAQVTTATQPYLTAGDVVRIGDRAEFGDLTYVLHYGFDRWRLQPPTPLSASTDDALEPVFAETNPRPTAPAEVGGDLTLASFNVLNYFTTFTEDDPDARGARNAAQFAVQKPKIVAAITALDADVVALQEIENSTHFGDGTPDVALADLVAALNDAAGADVWAYVPTPDALLDPAVQPGTDVIMNAIIHRTDAVSPVGDPLALVDPAFDDAREPVAQVFEPVGGGAPFGVVANHFKSKSPPDVTPVPEEPADGQGFFNAERVAQAQALAGFVAGLPTADVAVLGDLNAYSQEDPVVTLTDAGLVDLVAEHAAGQYTYTFDGELGSLDHALGTSSLAARVTGADVWDINADEWFGRQYYGGVPEAGTVYRASDHDPIVVGLSAAAAPVTIDLLGINDFHGRLEASPPAAGAAVLAGAVNAYRAANPNTLFVSAGDNIGASTFVSFIQEDVPTIEALNAMGLDASALGNHEFDQGRDDVDDRVLDLVDFPYLAANIYDRGTGEPAYDEYAISETGGVRVGFIGAMTELLPELVSPAGIATLEVRDLVTEVNRVAADLSDGDEANGEADVLVVLMHEGPETAAVEDTTGDTAFGDIVRGLSEEVDAIFAGHTHQRFAHLVPTDGGPALPVVSSGQYGEGLAHVQLVVDPATGDVVSSTADAFALVGAGFEPDPEVAAIVEAAVAAAEGPGSVQLGEITADFNRARQSSGSENRGGESTLGNLVADVQLWAANEAGIATDIAFMNPGGLRADLVYAPDGVVTYAEGAAVQPFANTLVTQTLTGAQVVQVLEEQWQPAGAARPFLRLGVAGLTYTYDPTAPAGERITQVWVDGVPIDPAAGYTVVANSFLAAGGDNFTTLGEGTGRTDTGRVDLQAMVDYLAEFTPASPDLAQRAVGVHVATPVPDGGFAPGDAVTVELSSLLFSGGEEQGSEVVLSIGGTDVATATIDPTIVDTTDEVGRASASFTVPADAPGGDLEVVVTVPSTGTTTSFTVPVAEAPSGPACVVEYDAVRVLGLLLGGVRVTNTGPDAVGPWSLTWSFSRGERAGVGIGAAISQRGADVTARGTVLNRTLDAGESTAFAFIGLAPRSTVAPTAFALNGVECAVE